MVRNGSLEWFHGHGVADLGSGTPVTEDTVFRIASISKTFTAIAVMRLWEQGLVDLDAPANDYLRAYRLIAAKARGVRKLGHRQGRLSRGCFVFVDEAAQQFVFADAPRGSPGGRRRGFVGRLKRE